MARSLKPTALYKSQRYQGPTITVNEEVSAPPIGGEILDVYWSVDLQGTNRTTIGDDIAPRYLIVKTKNIPDAVTLYLNSSELSTDDLSEGSLNSAIIIPLTVDGDGNGFGFYKIKMDDDVGFKNSKWVDVTSSRVFGTTYTNNTTAEIAISVAAATTFNVYSYINNVTIIVDGITILSKSGLPKVQTIYGSDSEVNHPGYDTVNCVVPPGSTYRVNANTTYNDDGGEDLAGKKSARWVELRPL